MNNQEIQDKLTRLSRAICCNKPKIVDELPEGTIGGGFVIFEDELYFWDGDSWEAVGGGSGGSVWGAITGTLSDQLDLQSELDNKQDLLISGTNIVTINGYDLLNSGDYSFDLPSGLGELDEGNGIGWRLVGRNPANYGNIGNGAVDFSHTIGPYNTGALGLNSVAFGYGTRATNNDAMVWGKGNLASGENATAWGLTSTASGYCSTAFGRNSTASGISSVAIGYFCNALAAGSFSSGRRNTANSFASTVIGNYATVASGQNLTSFVSTDELFKIGNGSTYGVTSDAFTIYKNAVQKVGGITATDASALTPQAGMIAYVTSTNGTFVTTGFWKYQGGAWSPF